LTHSRRSSDFTKRKKGGSAWRASRKDTLLLEGAAVDELPKGEGNFMPRKKALPIALKRDVAVRAEKGVKSRSLEGVVPSPSLKKSLDPLFVVRGDGRGGVHHLPCRKTTLELKTLF